MIIFVIPYEYQGLLVRSLDYRAHDDLLLFLIVDRNDGVCEYQYSDLTDTRYRKLNLWQQKQEGTEAVDPFQLVIENKSLNLYIHFH